MSLPAHRWSHLLQEFSQMFCVDQAFGQAAGNLGVVLKDRFSVDTIEKINQDLGASAGEFTRSRGLDCYGYCVVKCRESFAGYDKWERLES